MQIIESETSIVLLGNWNPAILQPDWLVKNGFGMEGEVPVTLEFSPVAGAPPRFTLQGLRFEATSDRVVITPQRTSDESLNQTEQVLRSILEKLSHTPIRAFGQNFEYEETNVSNSLARIFGIEDRLAEQVNFRMDSEETQLISSYRIDECKLNFYRKLTIDGNVRLRFNFHYDVTSADNARALLEGTFSSNFVKAEQIIEIYRQLNAETQGERNRA